MIFDASVMFSEAQAITADAASQNVIDLGAVTNTVYGASAPQTRDIGKGFQVPVIIQVVEAFNNLTSLRVVLQSDDSPTFSAPRDVIEQILPLASLKLGSISSIVEAPPGLVKRYVRLYYDITGTAPTTGKVTAGISAGNGY